ncbi:TetR/AcrR family transcriptional regulator C-terminal domain-containing protein [Streptomyces sp. NPDC089799]|uniref:TetR/AcrR family transcriptional regulator C-terminal domain-containing protein n=1 Tax=Streptomyces sp. NPDC089799 TaxID=3155066 RepID=UPI003414D9BE
MPRPRSLTPDRLAVAALAVIDHAGLPGLSMRAVATELGISTMALYRYVRDRDELEDLVLKLVLARVDTAVPSDAPWQDRVETLGTRLRDTLAAHPGVLPLTMTHRHDSQPLLHWTEAVLATLSEAVPEPAARAIALRALLSYVIGAIQLEHLGPLSGPGTTAMSELPPADFPHLTATARAARTLTPTDEFLGGLRLLLRNMT